MDEKIIKSDDTEIEEYKDTSNTSIIPIPVILIDSAHRKDENYSEVFLKKYHLFW